MGVGSILASREVILMATGENKASIIQKTLEQKIEDFSQCPAAYLRDHANCTFALDAAAGQNLARVKTPWLSNANIHWNSYLAKKYVNL